MRRSHKWILPVLLCLLLCGCAPQPEESAVALAAEQAEAAQQQTAPADSAAEKAPEEKESAAQTQSEPEKPPYQSPIDFEALHRQNADIYAWLTIPDTGINYPLVQRAGEDAYYLKHDIDGNASIAGAIYTESTYNSVSLDDPVTVIYGHQLYDGTMFSSLQTVYSSLEGLLSHAALTLYQPERELQYQIVAAVPIDTRHILYTYDFSDPEQYRLFFDELLGSRAVDAVICPETTLCPEDRVVILSTCYAGDYSKRFLVIAKQITEISE